MSANLAVTRRIHEGMRIEVSGGVSSFLLMMGLSVVGGPGCGDDPPTITLHARGAAMVAVDTGAGWEPRAAGDVTFSEPDGVYRLAVVCRADVGFARFDVAAPGDATEYARDCTPAVAATEVVTFDVRGDVYGIFIGDVATYTGTSALVAPGTYDVVATVDDGFANTVRAQVIRDVVVNGPTTITIDVAGAGQSLEDLELRAEPPVERQQVTGVTRRGTWFQLAAPTPRRLPPALRVAGDVHTLRASRWITDGADHGRRAERAIVIADDSRVIDATLVDSGETVTYAADPAPTVTWSSTDGWTAVTLSVAQLNEVALPAWMLGATPAALARGAVLAMPDRPPGWQAAWDVDPAGGFQWTSALFRDHDDGGWDALRTGGSVQAGR